MAQSSRNINQAPLLDAFLVTAAIAGIICACLILVWMAWQTPNVLASRQHATPTLSLAQALSTFVLTHTPTPTSTATATPAPPTPPPPTATLTPEPSPTPTDMPSPTATPSPTPTPLEASYAKQIVIDISDQTLTAFEGTRAVFSTLISGGQAYTPTPIGEFAIYSKIRSQTMSGPGYSLPNVEFVAYFYSSYAIHGAYWHNNFGHPMSHGCVNMRVMDAQWLYNWAPIGTPVSVRP
jgi:lipoprotein-anchoring transpeptidase ErfK/SrfK